MTATMAEINEEVSVNPDAQAAVTDFLDYTEHLPTDVFRSLALIRKLDETYETNESTLHDLTKTYGTLPSLPPEERPDPVGLRKSISRHLNLALNARESAYAEAQRLYDLADRHQQRLNSILAKLNAIEKPPLRDPTPPPPPAQLSVAKRSRSGKDSKVTTRITLKPPKHLSSALGSRPRHRRVTVPGEVKPPFDPDEPIASTEVSDWDSDPASPAKVPQTVSKPPPKHRSTTESERRPREIVAYHKPTPPPEDAPLGGEHRPWMHLTEYEMYKLRKKMKKNHTWEPSEVMIKRELADKGRGLDNYQKAKAAAASTGAPFIDIDQPTKVPSVRAESETLKVVVPKEEVVRPKVLKRSESKPEKKESTPKDPSSLAAHEAQLAARRLGDIGSQFANLFQNFKNSLGSLTSTASPTATTPKTEQKSSKKRKMEAPLPSSPLAEPDPTPAAKKQKLMSRPSPLIGGTESPAPAPAPVPVPASAPASGPGPASAPASAPALTQIPITVPKPTLPVTTLKLTVNAQSSGAQIPQTINTLSNPTRPSSAHRRVSAVGKLESTPPPSSRPPSRRSAAMSTEPPASTTTSTTTTGSTNAIATSSRPSRTSSVTPAAVTTVRTPTQDTTPKPPTFTAASRRSKREAPGTVTQSSQDGGATVSVSKRKNKPTILAKPSRTVTPKVSTSDLVKPEIRTDIDGRQELVDPEEERYCICGDVSWGEMIACELEDKCEFGEWFHMECVELTGMPPRTTKWYCPGDRKKYHKGEKTNGLVRYGS